MNSNMCVKPSLGTFKSMSSPMSSGATKRRKAYCFTSSICLLRVRVRLAISVVSAKRSRAKGEEATPCWFRPARQWQPSLYVWWAQQTYFASSALIEFGGASSRSGVEIIELLAPGASATSFQATLTVGSGGEPGLASANGPRFLLGVEANIPRANNHTRFFPWAFAIPAKGGREQDLTEVGVEGALKHQPPHPSDMLRMPTPPGLDWGTTTTYMLELL